MYGWCEWPGGLTYAQVLNYCIGCKNEPLPTLFSAMYGVLIFKFLMTFFVLLLVFSRILVNLLADDISNMIGCMTD